MITKFPIDRFEQTKTPFYYYDIQLLRETLQHIKDAVGDNTNFHVHYAIKANANPALLTVISEFGLGADCVSGGEVSCALNNNFKHDKIVFAGVGKTDDEIRYALDKKIACFNVESLPELENISRIANELGVVAPVAFRVNPNVDAHTHEKITTGLHENKFGISPEELLPAIRYTEQLPNVVYKGLHFHIGSQILEMQPYHLLCERINELQDYLEENGVFSPTINVGGGLGVNYDYPTTDPIPNFKEYFNIYRKYLKIRTNQHIHFELGRSVVAQCGSLITRVLYVKEGLTKKFVILDAGMTDLIRPAMYGALHQIMNLTADIENNSTEVYDVVGPVCESSDTFAINYKLPITKRGDLMAICSAGAYGETMASRYNLREIPKYLLS